jgi:hypothetical protein
MRFAAAMSLVVMLLAVASPALAKVPWSSVEMTPPNPVASEPFVVVIHFWDGASRTEPSTSWPDHGGGRLEFQGVAGQVPVAPIATGVGTFRAELTLPEGTWRLVAIQRFSEASGPADVEVATVTVSAAPFGTVPIGAAAVGVAVLATGAIWRRRRSATPIGDTP